MFPKKILLAADGSTGAERAARTAVNLSNSLGSELHLVYVEPMRNPYPIPEATLYNRAILIPVREQAEDEARKNAETREREVEELGGKVAGVHAKAGRPDDEILRLAEELGAGLVVLGSRGLGPLRRALMGSVSSSVVRHAHGSVLVVRGEQSLPGRVLLATDGSGEARAAREAAVEIAAATGSELHILHVLDTEPYRPHLGPEMWEGWEDNLERAKQHAWSFVERQAAQAKSEGVAATETYVFLDKPAAEIVRLGEDLGAGLIVVGSRGLGGVRRALMGSVSDSVVRHAHCPVLVVRQEKGASS
jgi:nucleotide-binding universal stress UspA family protein